MDLDWKTPKYRHGRNANNSSNDNSAGEGRKLRKCRRNNNNNSNNNSNNNNSTINSLRSQSTRQSPVFNNDTNISGGVSRRRSRVGADSTQQLVRDDSPIPPGKKTKDAKAEFESTQIWECSEGTCGKKFKHATGLKYHQTHVHRKLPTVVVNGNVVEELKENSPSVAIETPPANKKSKKSSRNGTPDLKSERVSPVAEIVNDPQNLSELNKLTPKSITPEPETCSSPTASLANDLTEAVPRPGKRKFADISAEDNDVKPDITKIASGSSTETSSIHSSSTESRTDFVSSPLTQDEDCKPVNFAPASAEMPRSPATGNVSSQTPGTQDAPLNCKTSFESVPENVVKTEPTTTPVKTQQREIKQEPNVVKPNQNQLSAESDRAQGNYMSKDSPWRDSRVPPLNSQMAAPIPYPPSMFGFGIDPIYHMQLMASPEHRSQFDRWLTEQHYRQMYGRFDMERNSLQEAKPVDMTLKSSASSQDQSKLQKKADAYMPKRPAPTANQNSGSSVCHDKKVHSNKKMPPPTPPITPQSEDKKKFLNFKSERLESRQQESSPGQMLRGAPRSGVKEADLALFPQGYPYAHPLAKLPYELQPNMHASPFLDPAAAQAGLARANPHFLDRVGIPENKLEKEQIKMPSGKRSVEASDDLHKETSSSKDKSASLQSPVGGHNSPLTLRHLHTHHHTHVLGPAYSLYSSYNGLCLR